MIRMREYALLALVSVFLLGIAPTHATVIKAAGDGFWDTGMRLCDVDADGNCHTSDYAWSIARFGFGGVAAAILTFLILLLFLPIRFLCNGFGGRNPSYGVCPSKSAKTRVYTRKQILSVKIIAAIILIPIIIAVAIGFQANTEMSDSIEDITVSLVESGEQIRNDLITTREVVLSVTNDANARSILDGAVNTATDVSNRLQDAHDTTNKYDDVRQSLMIAGFVLSVVMIVLGIICAIFNLRVIAMFLAIFGLIGLVIVWLCFGVHLVADKFVYDVCVDIDLLTSNDTSVSNATSAFKTGPLARLWACDNNTQLVQLQEFIDTSITQAADTVCDLRAQLCYNTTDNSGNPDFQCQSSPRCNRDTLAVVTDAQHMQIYDNGQIRSLSDCASACTNDQYRNASSVVVTGIAAYENYTNIYYNTMLPILNCQIAVRVLLEVRPPLCEDVFDSMYGVAIASLIVGIFYIPFIILMIVGFKRFQSLNGGIV